MNKNCFLTQTILMDFNSADEVVIPSCECEINEIIESSCNVWIYDKKVILSSNEYKLILRGHKYIKTSYTTCECDGRVYYSKLILPFFETISIPPCSNIKSITADVSYCDINVCKNILWICSITSVKVDYYLNLNNTFPKCICTEYEKCDYNFKNDTYKSDYKHVHNNLKDIGNSKVNKNHTKEKETPNKYNMKSSFNSFENFFDNCESSIESVYNFNENFSKYDITDDFNVDVDMDDTDTFDYLEAFDNEE